MTPKNIETPNELTQGYHEDGIQVKSSGWDPRFYARSKIFLLFPCFLKRRFALYLCWPKLSDLNQMLKVLHCVSGAGLPVLFVKQPLMPRKKSKQKSFVFLYQPRIFLTGEIPTREHNWHDFFNALSWLMFPKFKAELNRRHWWAFESNASFPWVEPAPYRTSEQDMLTLLDEGGIVIVCSDDDLWELVKAKKWATFFEYPCLKQRMMVFVLGHGIFECALERHPSLHGSAIRLKDLQAVKNVLDEEQRLAYIDSLLAIELAKKDVYSKPEDLVPFPLSRWMMLYDEA